MRTTMRAGRVVRATHPMPVMVRPMTKAAPAMTFASATVGTLYCRTLVCVLARCVRILLIRAPCFEFNCISHFYV